VGIKDGASLGILVGVLVGSVVGVVGIVVGIYEGRLVGLNEGLINIEGFFFGHAVLVGVAVTGTLVVEYTGLLVAASSSTPLLIDSSITIIFATICDNINEL